MNNDLKFFLLQNHILLRDKIKIIVWEEAWKNSTFVGLLKPVSRLCIQVNLIWEPLIKKARLKKGI